MRWIKRFRLYPLGDFVNLACMRERDENQMPASEPTPASPGSSADVQEPKDEKPSAPRPGFAREYPVYGYE